MATIATTTALLLVALAALFYFSPDGQCRKCYLQQCFHASPMLRTNSDGMKYSKRLKAGIEPTTSRSRPCYPPNPVILDARTKHSSFNEANAKDEFLFFGCRNPKLKPKTNKSLFQEQSQLLTLFEE